MSLTSAMLIGFTGIKSNGIAVDTIGDNVANVNTTAFKSQRALFETLLYRTIRGGEAPEDPLGGTNPLQVGYGSGVAAIQRNFAQGSVQATGVASDLAIDGQGFFVVHDASGNELYTRDGSIRLNADNVLVTAQGDFVQGFVATGDGTVTPGALSNLTIPVGSEMSARATTSAAFDGNLDAGAAPATDAAVAVSAAWMTSSGPATASTPLTSLVNEAGGALLAAGDVIAISGVQKGGVDVPAVNFSVGSDGSTLGDLADYLESAFGIQTDPALGESAGVSVGDGSTAISGVTAPAGALVVTSNLGEANAITLNAGNVFNAATGESLTSFTSTPALGDGVTTGFVVFDSLGLPVEVRLRLALESAGADGGADAMGPVWRFYADSVDAGGLDTALGHGTITFDPNGQFLAATGTELTIDRSGQGGASPVSVSLDFSAVNGLADPFGDSTLLMNSQNGVPAGTLIGYGIDNDGLIEASFSNGSTQVLGQVALATFVNPEGLEAQAGNRFAVGANSGAPAIGPPRTGAAGRIQSGALELSNVDLSREFIGLIEASTGVSAASRVVRTADELLQELLLLAR